MKSTDPFVSFPAAQTGTDRPSSPSVPQPQAAAASSDQMEEIPAATSEVASEGDRDTGPSTGARAEPIPETESSKKSRESYSFIEKAEILDKFHELSHGVSSFRDIAKTLNIPRRNLQRWINEKDEIVRKAADETLRNLRKGRPNNRHNSTQHLLYNEFIKRRKTGRKVDLDWCLRIGQKIAEKKGLPFFTKYAAEAFIKKYGIKVRRVQRRKQVDKTAYEDDLRNWHYKLREEVIKSGHMNPNYDLKYGRFSPSRRYNVDQGGNSIENFVTFITDKLLPLYHR